MGLLLDDTNAKRSPLFSTPTHKDMLGTFGASWEAKINKFSLNLEAARNFGKAKSSDETYKDVEHAGYAFYADTQYEFSKFSPHSRFLYASGNRVTTEMVDSDAEYLTSGKNRAFSNYSPFNTALADSHYPNFGEAPMVAMGNGNGLNYGVPRPGTFGDPRLPENIILTGLGFDYAFSDKLSFTCDWWLLKAAEKGIGKFDSLAKELSTDLGNEIDASFSYAVNDNIEVSLSGGYFFPGKYYKEERDGDDSGALFTPLVRGDGRANNAYQIELSVEMSF